jgi:hypothetical protein
MHGAIKHNLLLILFVTGREGKGRDTALLLLLLYHYYYFLKQISNTPQTKLQTYKIIPAVSSYGCGLCDFKSTTLAKPTSA